MKDQDSVGRDTWLGWILEAIRKIRQQKQRPSVERISHAIRQHHPFSIDAISEQLEIAVKDGNVLKVFNKGQSSYKDPGGMQNRQLTVVKGSDLSKVIAKAARELNESEGSTLKSIEKYIRQSHAVNLSGDVDFRALLRISIKRAVARGLVTQDGRLFKPVPRAPGLPKESRGLPSSHGGRALPQPGDAQEFNNVLYASAALPICSECLGTASRNRQGRAEALSACAGCGARVHLSCVPGGRGDCLGAQLALGAVWRCEECVVCQACHRPSDQ
ncbi:Uncharacterized protein GBIM_07680, partial [Gryllus bimaculatus]